MPPAAIDPAALDASLIVRPDVPFPALASALAALGWTRDERAAITPPLIPGEPELAGWTWRGGWPRLTYTFNPVVRLRVLDAGLLSPAMRADIAHKVPLVLPDLLSELLAAREPRAALLGLYIVRETEQIALAPQVEAARQHADAVVRRGAAEVAEALDRQLAAKARVVALTQHLESQVRPMLRKLTEGDPADVLALAPTPEDCAALFRPEVARPAAEAYAALWREPPRIDPGASYTELDVTAAPAGMLRTKNELSWAFPQGYRDIAGWLVPAHVWVRWRYRRPGARAGVAYDGLAWTGERWAWCPRPYRVLGEILREPVH